MSLRKAIWRSGHTLMEVWAMVCTVYPISYSAFSYNARLDHREPNGIWHSKFWKAVDFALMELDIDW